MKTENSILGMFKCCILVFIICFTFAGAACGNNNTDNKTVSDKTETKNIDAYISLADEYNDGISVIALSINKYLKGHSDFKNKEETDKLIDEAKTLEDKIKSTIDEVNKLNDADSKLQKQLIKCLELEATRIDGLYMGMKKSQEGKDFLPDFKRGGIAAEEFEKEHRILLQMSGMAQNNDTGDEISLGGVSLNNTESEVRAKLGEPKIISTKDDITTFEYDDIMLEIVNQKVKRIYSMSDRVKTSRGISQNSSIHDIVKAYDNSYSVKENKSKNVYCLEYSFNDKDNNPYELKFFCKAPNFEFVDFIMLERIAKKKEKRKNSNSQDTSHPERIRPTVKGGESGNGYNYFVIATRRCSYCGQVETLTKYGDDIMMPSPEDEDCPKGNPFGHTNNTILYFNSYRWSPDNEEWVPLGNEINHIN